MRRQIKPISMRCDKAQFESVKQELIDVGMDISNADLWDMCRYITNNYNNSFGIVGTIADGSKTDYNRTVFEEFNREILLEYCGIGAKQEPFKITSGKGITLTSQHSHGSISFGSAGAKVINSLTDSNMKTMKTITQEQLDKLFEIATPEQLPILEEMFGIPPIDYDKIKTGSKVMVKRTGENCGGIESVNLNEPLDVVFFCTPHFINIWAKFFKKMNYTHYITLHQHGKFVLFGGDNKDELVKCITRVIEY